MTANSNLAQAVAGLERALTALDPTADVEGHSSRLWSDERLKQGVDETRSALASLRELATMPSTATRAPTFG